MTSKRGITDVNYQIKLNLTKQKTPCLVNIKPMRDIKKHVESKKICTKGEENCRHSNARVGERINFLNSLSPSNLERHVQIITMNGDPSQSKFSSVTPDLISQANFISEKGSPKHSPGGTTSIRNLPKKRIKRNFVKEKISFEDKIEKLSKGDRLKFLNEKQLFSQQISSLKKAELKQIE